MRVSFEQWISINGCHLGLIWQTDELNDEEIDSGVEGDLDGVLVDNGRIVWASSPGDLAAAASRYGLTFEPAKSNPQRLDGLEKLFELPISDETCSQLNGAWNLLGDIACSVDASLDDTGPEAEKCYDKLFFGLNLDSITPVGEHYSPAFDAEEVEVITAVLERGRAILMTHL